MYEVVVNDETNAVFIDVVSSKAHVTARTIITITAEHMRAILYGAN